jgi:DNA-directed RNA polymerase specialized sigma24 family protein
MTTTDPEDHAPIHAGAHFATTQWNLILTAADSTAPGSEAALEQLCRSYWYPIYAYVRRRGHSVEEAQDHTQGFFVYLLKHHTLHYATPERGRFRHFLLASVQRYLVSEHRFASAQKRKAKLPWLPWNENLPVPAPADPPLHMRSAEEWYDHQWAITLLEKVLRDLEADCARSAHPGLFEQLKPHLCINEQAVPYNVLAQQLGMSPITLRVTVHRFRQRYRELIRAEIAKTVVSPDEIDDEIRHLIEVAGW